MVAARRAAARMIDSLTSRDRFCAIAFDDHDRDDSGDRARARRPIARGSAPSRQLAHDRRARWHRDRGTAAARRWRCSPAATMIASASSCSSPTARSATRITMLRDARAAPENVRMFTLGIDQAVNAGVPAPARRPRRRHVRARRIRGSARRGDGEVPSPDRHADRDRARAARVGPRARDRASIAPTHSCPTSMPARRSSCSAAIAARRRRRVARARRARASATRCIAARRAHGDARRDELARRRAGRARRFAISRIATRSASDAARGRDRARVEAVHGVLSRFTAFLAVDRSEVANAGGARDADRAVGRAPAGWDSPRGARRARHERWRGRARARRCRRRSHAAPRIDGARRHRCRRRCASSTRRARDEGVGGRRGRRMPPPARRRPSPPRRRGEASRQTTRAPSEPTAPYLDAARRARARARGGDVHRPRFACAPAARSNGSKTCARSALTELAAAVARSSTVLALLATHDTAAIATASRPSSPRSRAGAASAEQEPAGVLEVARYDRRAARAHRARRLRSPRAAIVRAHVRSRRRARRRRPLPDACSRSPRACRPAIIDAPIAWSDERERLTLDYRRRHSDPDAPISRSRRA